MNKSIFSIPRPPILSDIAYDRIKELIMNGHFAPSEIIYETDLVRTFDISRTPIREALIRLENQGWLTPRSQGYGIAPITILDIENIYEMRTLLEPQAIRYLARNHDDEEIERYYGLLELVEGEILSGEYRLFYEIHSWLHSAYINKCPNDILRKAISELNERMVRIRIITGHDPEKFAIHTIHEQQEIMEALRANDPEASASGLVRHLTHSCERVIQHVKSWNITRQ